MKLRAMEEQGTSLSAAFQPACQVSAADGHGTEKFGRGWNWRSPICQPLTHSAYLNTFGAVTTRAFHKTLMLASQFLHGHLMGERYNTH